VYDRSKLVHATLRTVAKNLIEGGLLVIAVLFALLGSLRAGLLVALVIPLSMVFALAGMAALDIPGNLMSLGAIDFGLLVDGAVVMVEAVFCGALGRARWGRRRWPR
jgi:cobalt-zinc-cadmium resistance protein CzcA